MKEVLRISSDLYSKLINERASRARGRVFVLGMNSEGLCVTAHRLKVLRGWGCIYMPGIPGEELARVRFELAKKGLDFGGFAHTTIADPRKNGWNYIYGGSIFDYPPGTRFLTFGPTRIICKVRNAEREVVNLKHKVVKTTKSKTLKEEQSNVRNNRDGNRPIRKVNKAASKVRGT
jgi:hypothetical protein